MTGGRVIRDDEGPEFARLFRDVRTSWFRLETLQRYDVAYERDAFSAFLHGKPAATAPGPWQAMIRQHVASNRSLARVHVIEEPLTDYIRWELAAYVPSMNAGEDIRVIPVHRGAWPPGVPRHDYWLFDDERLWLMEYDADGAFQAARHIDDSAAVRQHRQWRDAALAQSISLADYAAAHQQA